MRRLCQGLAAGLIGLLLLVPSLPADDPSGTLPESKVEDFLRKQIPYLQGTVSFQRESNFYVQIPDRIRRTTVEVYRRNIRETQEGKELVEESLGTAELRVEGPDLARLVPEDFAANTIRLGDQVRSRQIRLQVLNKKGWDAAKLESLLLEHPGIDEVDFVEDSSKVQPPFLLFEEGSMGLFLSDRERADASLDLRPRYTEAEGRSRDGNLRSRARFERTVHDFEWIRLPTRSPIHLIALASEGSVGFARFEDEVTGIHWLDVNGTVLDLSIRTVSSENPGKIYFLAVIRRDDGIRTRSYSFNALDRTLREEWTASNVWIRGTADGRFYAQEIGLNVPFSRTLRRIEVSSDGWDVGSSEKLSFSETVIPPGYASRAPVFGYLNDAGRLRVREESDSERSFAAEFGGDPRSVSPRRNDKSRSLQPEFALNTSGDTLHAFLPRNIPSGLTIVRGLRSYKRSRLFLIEAGSDTARTLWESNLQSGYVSGTEYFEETYWAILVDPTNGSSTLKEFRLAPEP